MSTAGLSLLGISVDAATIDRWRGWFAPEVQPFVVDGALHEVLGAREILTGLPLELRDTYRLYGDSALGRVIGLRRPEFDATVS